MIKLTKPYIPDKAIKNAIEVIKSGNLVQGKYVERFEEKLCEYLNVKNSILVSNGTAALHLSLIALRIGKGDEVIVPAFTFPATANVVEIVGATTILVDINLDDFCINAKLIEKAITKNTKAIIPVHEFGQSAKMDEIVRIAEKYNLIIIEDAACALGTEFNNKKVGTIGNVGCFSFHPRKAITTGEGGAIVTNDDSIADKLRSLRNHGLRIDENQKYDFIYCGLNYRMTDFQAALGLGQLEIIEQIISKRVEIADYYDKNLSEIDWLTVPKRFKQRRMIYQTYHLLVEDKIDRNTLIKFLNEHGIETNFGANYLSELTYFKKKYNNSYLSTTNASKACKCGIAIPMSYSQELNESNSVIETIKSYLSN